MYNILLHVHAMPVKVPNLIADLLIKGVAIGLLSCLAAWLANKILNNYIDYRVHIVNDYISRIIYDKNIPIDEVIRRIDSLPRRDKMVYQFWLSNWDSYWRR